MRPHTNAIHALFQRELGVSPSSITAVKNGRNSRVLRVRAADSGYILKHYFTHADDCRDRLGTEFQALRFLMGRGITCIPEPICMDADAQMAVYSHIPGKRCDETPITIGDIDTASAFLIHLNRLCADPKSERLPSASDAVCCPAQIEDKIHTRLQALAAVADLPGNGMLGEFLEKHFAPVLHSVVDACKHQSKEIAWDAPVLRAHQTLSPSDFGFHNAIRRPDGGIAFIDFEFFGWDDPAKMISDFLLHPAMDLSRQLKTRFMAASIQGLGQIPGLQERVGVYYPMIGLLWCTILLNEFIPMHHLRRHFAGDTALNQENIKTRQLKKGEAMLLRLMEIP